MLAMSRFFSVVWKESGKELYEIAQNLVIKITQNTVLQFLLF